MSRGKEFLDFMNAAGVSISEIEKRLVLSRGTLKWNDGFPVKHLGAIEKELRDHYGYNEKVMDQVIEQKPERVLRWNGERPYDFGDGLSRYQDEWGLWRVVPDEVMNDKAVNNKWHPATGEIEQDWRGMFMVLRNGVKAYVEAYDDVLRSRSKWGINYWKKFNFKNKKR